MKFAGLRITLLSLVIATPLAGCGHVPISTMYRLWSFDAANADPADIRAAVRYPAALRPRNGGAKLTMTLRDGGKSAPQSTSFVLQEVTDPPELRQLGRFERQGYPLTVYRLTDADTFALRRIQSDIASARQRGEKTTGDLGISIDACHVHGLPPGALLSSTYLRLDSASGYLVVLDDVDLRKEIDEQTLIAKIPPCAGT